eukprot:TRINITY_DN6997_c0_g1_i1.p1 TRINITY_DN6997_c0_g1~~TRINITY_DN6997_c0_g1_i1.p1  ORF type:complete len:255 (+),score=46.12 TRINITY_DN6997_c0_g1_i1:68-832(+)
MCIRDRDKLFLLLDYCPGGDLSELLQKKKKLSEEEAKIYVAEVLLGLEHLHQKDIIFRDLKPENVVLDKDGHAHLTDFGLSKEGIMEQVKGTQSFCGSVAYLAPEMLKKIGHGKAVDWYLLGLLLYELLVGVPPYYSHNREELFQNIETGPLKIPSTMSEDAKSLIVSLLQRNPAKRLGSGKRDSQEIKEHPFFKDIVWQEVYERKLKPPKIEIKKVMKTPQKDVFDTPTTNQNQDLKQTRHISNWTFIASNKV